VTPPEGAAAHSVTVRYWAAAREAAGVREEALPVVVAPEASPRSGEGGDPPPGAGLPTVGDVLAEAARRHPALSPVLALSSVLADGRVVRAADPVPAGALLEVLPPFAGG
jgi:molybdopterin converting factor small subunit